MSQSESQFKTIDEYIKLYPVDVQNILNEIRAVIRKEAPDALETISYQMPTFKLYGVNLVHFAAWKSHIGFYPTPSVTTQFEKELAEYKYAKGSIQFPLNEKIPYEFIKKVVRYRVDEVTAKKKK